MHAAVFLLSLAACPSSNTDKPGGDNAVTAPSTVVKADPLADARKLLAAGKSGEAMKAAEKLIADHPEQDEGWELVEIAAIRGGAAGELVDRLSADKAIGGRVERHQLLRGILAIEANRLGDALNAARALQTVAPGDAAALVAMAVKKGAPAPEGADATTAALLKWQSDPAAPVDAAVESLGGWRIALVRGAVKLERGDKVAAQQEAARATGGGIRGAELGAVLAIGAAANADDAVKAADVAARAAMAGGDAGGAAEVLEAALPVATAGWRAGTLATLATEMRKSAADAKDDAGAARIAAAEAGAALRAGRPLAAREAATLASAAPSSRQVGGWILALADSALGDRAGVEAVASQLGEPQATGARELALAMAGEDPTLPSIGLKGDDAALQALNAAGWLDNPGPALAAAASMATSPDLQLWANAWVDRTTLAAPADAPPTQLTEAHARGLLSGAATGPLAETSHPAAVHWNSALSGDPGVPGTAGVSAWPRARAALASGDSSTAAREYGTLALAVPSWRSGPWLPALVLDGPTPDALVDDSARVQKSGDPLPVAVALHGWSHRREEALALWQHGVEPFGPAATVDQRKAVWDAVSGLRVGELAWLAGAGAYPTAAADALGAAETAAGLQRFQSPTITAIRGSLEAAAVMSLRQVGDSWEALYLTPTGGKLTTVKPTIAQQMDQWILAIGKGDSAVASGDRLRSQIVDPATDLMLGIGRYLLVGPAPFGTLPVPAMPEQADGLRYLAEIRHVSHFADFDALVAPPQAVQDEYQLSVIAFCATPAEAETMRRTFPGATVLEGKDATVTAWKDKAGGARFVHLGDFDAAPGGGWKLADGVLTLADVVSTPLAARNGYFGGTVDSATVMARIEAVRRTGMQDALVGGFWQDPTIHDRVVLHYWEGVNRRYTASRSFAEARSLSIKEAGPSGKVPVNWAGYVIAGKP